MVLPRVLLFLTAIAIFALGLVMIFSTASAEIMDHELNMNTHQALIKQILYAVIGLLIAWGVMKMGYHRLIDYSPFLLGLFTVLLICTLIPGIGKEVNGSRRWLSLAGFSFQPSEFVKYLIPFVPKRTSISGEIFISSFFFKKVSQINNNCCCGLITSGLLYGLFYLFIYII